MMERKPNDALGRGIGGKKFLIGNISLICGNAVASLIAL
jgi:hypothetical protein